MTVSLSAQTGSKEQSDTHLAGAIMSTLRVSLPGIIQSFNADKVTAVVQPAIKGVVYDPSGAPVSKELPQLVDVPVIFPRGGGCTLTFPVSEGDECLVIFADRCIDFWWQNGGVQKPVDGRMHDLSDAFALVGPQSQARKISAISASGTQLRTDDGSAFIELASGGDITLNTTGQLTANAQGGTTLTSPTIVLNGNVTINGNLSQGMGESGGTATIQGPMTVNDDVIAGGKSLMTHTHGGVETGSGNTGGPN